MDIFRVGVSVTVFVLLIVGNRADWRNDYNEGTSTLDANDSFALDYRLPKAIVPVHYDINLSQINLDPLSDNAFKFNGNTAIQAFVQEPTDTIILHSGRINVSGLSVLLDGKPIDIVVKNHNIQEKYEIELDKVLAKGVNISINFKYTGELKDDMIGFYRSSYIDSKGNIRWLASTQFQTTHARHAFPCFDEPGFKATFQVTILLADGYTCLSNMRLNKRIEAGKGDYLHEFEQSIPMSTYLVAFIIADFGHNGDDNFKVWARPNAISQTQYALDIGPRGLKHLAELFKQPYQISKMDMVAVPDFAAGAMENWGLVTYRESRLLYDKKMSSDVAQQSVASVIVHELTHMWFGNMITPEWWSCLWLSEAFARYYQYFGTAQVETSWNMEQQFLVEQHQSALGVDGLETSKPMTRNVSSSADVAGIGDTITYNKGASIVRMMSFIFGQDVFITGLQNYLKNNKENKVASPQNLWKEFQSEIDRRNEKLDATVEKIMSTWTEQSGFPVLTVSIQNGEATMRQQRFLLRNLNNSPTKLTWWIPITWTSENNPRFDIVNIRHWMNKENDMVKLDTASGWVIFNVQSSGFYRVNYDNASWYRIIDVLNSYKYKDIHVLNRAALVDDLLNLARAGLVDYKVALDGVEYIEQETNYLPFKSAFTAFSYIDQRFSGHDTYHKEFKRFVLKLVEERYNNIGFLDGPKDDRLTVLLRSELNKWACNYDHEGCVWTFIGMFQKWKTNNTLTIPPNQRATAYCTAIRHGTKEDWEFLWDQYFHSNFASDQSVILQALGCTEDNSLRERYLFNALKSFEQSRIRKQDSTAVFSAVYGSSLSGAEFVLDFIDRYHLNMTEYYKGTDTISSILSSASQRFSTAELVDKFEKIIEKHKTPLKDIYNSLITSLGTARSDLKWFNTNGDPILSWITAFNNRHDTKAYRLPGNIIPREYSINVTPHIGELSNFTFDGSVQISADVTSKTESIVLHAANVTINRVNVSVNDKALNIVSMTVTKKYDFLTINLGQQLQVGDRVNIEINYSGYLNEEMRGFYRSSYTNDLGETRWLAATHMEPVAARKMFPCFDEPALKATFSMTATVPQGYSAISNMPIQNSIILRSGETTIKFMKTPKMSTYLVALVVSDFDRTASEMNAVWSRPNAVLQAQFAVSVMSPLVTYYDNLLEIPYQLPKLDMVALPDFASGAMENWGLLTYKERNVLYDAEESTASTKQSIANVISHEITHQWFGNLVSPLWWTYTWLNEGFARYFQYFGTARALNFTNDWNLESQFVVDHLHSALETDSSATSHAMTHEVYSPTEIRGMFDTISYAKAASVIRMLRKLFGPDIFDSALRSYLAKLKYDVAKPEDLFDAFKEKLSDVTIRNSFNDIMQSWTTQPGYPVVHFSIQNKRLSLKQERFLIEPKNSNSTDPTWYVPITWTSLNKPNFGDVAPKYWLSKAQDSIVFPDGNSDIFIFNLQQTGFYRTNYDEDHWRRIISFLNSNTNSNDFQTINEINRAAIIDDLMNLGRAGYVDYEIVLNATQYLRKETSYVPWRAFFNGLTYLRRQIQGRDAYDAYKRYLNALIQPIYDSMKFDDNEKMTHERKMLKMYIRKWACELGISDCESSALRYLDDLINGIIDKIPPNYRSVSYCTAARVNPSDYWSVLWENYLTAAVASDKAVILQSLTCTTNATYLDFLLQKAIQKGSDIRFEDSSSVFSNVISASLEGADFVMDFIKNNYNTMLAYYNDVSTIKSMVTVLGRRLTTDSLYTKYMNLVAWLAQKDPSIRSSLNAYKSRVNQELSWADKYVPKIHEWMERNYPDLSYRLPSSVSPLKYNVLLAPYFQEKNFMFTGNVQITMKRHRSTSRLVLNSHQLNIKNVSLYESDSNFNKGKPLNLNRFTINETRQMLTIFTNNLIKSEEIIIDIEFNGILNDNLEGFYRSYYFDSENHIRWLATTQFEPTYARKAFPCFDEPAFKAKFVIQIERPKDYIALSNMPSTGVSASEVSDRVRESFAETELMSPYLVAFVVCDFKHVRDSYVKVNIWGRPEISANGDYAQVAAMRMLDLLATETGHEYTLPKLDLIGIPDFSMGAMENWGLATFREYGLFYKHNVTTAKYADYILTIIAHELAHMWYGNLVTCDWWDHIWLNEGFAEYMQWRIASLFKPSHGFQDLFVVDELQAAMQSDDYPSSHPMNHPVSTPSEIANVFDTITYGKSSSVLRMIHKSLDPEVFSKATYQYLLRRRYNTSTPKDLWEAFDDAIKETNALGNWEISMESLMDHWTNTAGYPLVTASFYYGKITLTQKRFSLKNKDVSDGFYFWIPITIASSSNVNFITTSTKIWLGPNKKEIMNPSTDDWFLLNVQQSGYYRVNYDKDSWLRLMLALKKPTHSSIHVTNRAQIVDDLLNLARGDYIDYELALNGTTYLKKEKDYLPWKAFFNGINFIVQRSEGHNNTLSVLNEYILKLTSEIYEKIDFVDNDDENHLNQLSRDLILTWVCKFNETKCVNTAKKSFANWRSSLVNRISPNARPAIYCTAIRFGSDADWRFLWEQYLATQFASEKKIILDALGCTRQETLLREYIQYALSRNYTANIRKQDVSAALASIYTSGQFGLEVMLDYLLQNYENVYAHYGEWNSVGQLFSKVASRISTPQQIEKLSNFIKTKGKNIISILSTLESSLKTAEDNYKWYQTHYNQIDTWLSWYNNGGIVFSSLGIVSMTIFSIIVYMLSQ
ncbi:putative aminopeptidase-2 [Hylaeus anthracinus]|uniref:putative aminopeptidase-2 n=1 Tax=Hylaeus anthracinus TaxID=313031 RepID=UPI0023B949FF|nr:putative aminopeptidase-2 [Hylaeus anthracinus]XP_054001941.1 putative aminopeptidase-2 [Hylaeus anthracinus]